MAYGLSESDRQGLKELLDWFHSGQWRRAQEILSGENQSRYRVKNDSNATIEAFEPRKIASVSPLPNAEETRFKTDFILVTDDTEPGEDDHILIPVERIRPNTVGQCVMPPVTPMRIKLSNIEHKFTLPNRDSAESGPLEIAWVDRSAPGEKWGLVEFTAGGGGGSQVEWVEAVYEGPDIPVTTGTFTARVIGRHLGSTPDDTIITCENPRFFHPASTENLFALIDTMVISAVKTDRFLGNEPIWHPTIGGSARVAPPVVNPPNP